MLKIRRFYLHAYSLMEKMSVVIRNISIFKRLIVSFLIIIIIPNFIIGYVSFSKSSKQIDSNQAASSLQFIAGTNNLVMEKLKKYNELSYEISTDDDICRLLYECAIYNNGSTLLSSEKYKQNKSIINSYLYNSTPKESYIYSVEIVSNKDEFTQIDSEGTLKGGFIRDLDSFRKSPNYQRALDAKGNAIWCDTQRESDVLLNQRMRDVYIANYMTLMRTVEYPGMSEPIGVIVINVSTNIFSEIWSLKEMSDYGSLFLLGKSGIVSVLDSNLRRPPVNDEICQEILTLKKGNISRSINGKKYMIAFQRSDYTGWVLVSMIPREKLDGLIYEVRSFIFRLCIFLIIFAALVSYVVTFSISNPLNRLKKTMEKVDEKNLDLKYEDGLNDEIGALGRKFNKMITRINNLINTIYEVELEKKSETLRRKEAELDALQMQINPHFIYNTLDMMRWRVIMLEEGEGEVSCMVESFEDLLRLGTKKTNKLVSINEEIEHVKVYVKMVGLTHKKQISLNWDIEDISICNCGITKLTLQPIVENAVIHGFTRSDRNNEIVMKIFKEGESVIIEVRDSGKGMSEAEVERLSDMLLKNVRISNSIGLHNVNERIKLFFGNAYGLDIRSKAGEGTVVTVRIPIVDAKDTNAH